MHTDRQRMSQRTVNAAKFKCLSRALLWNQMRYVRPTGCTKILQPEPLLETLTTAIADVVTATTTLQHTVYRSIQEAEYEIYCKNSRFQTIYRAIPRQLAGHPDCM